MAAAWIEYIYSTFSMDDRAEAAKGNYAWPNFAKMTMDWLVNKPFDSAILNDFREKYNISNPIDVRNIVMRACVAKAQKQYKNLDLTVEEYQNMWSTYAE